MNTGEKEQELWWGEGTSVMTGEIPLTALEEAVTPRNHQQVSTGGSALRVKFDDADTLEMGSVREAASLLNSTSPDVDDHLLGSSDDNVSLGESANDMLTTDKDVEHAHTAKQERRNLFARRKSEVESMRLTQSTTLPHDTHSFLITAHIRSIPFVTSLLVFSSKVVLSLLITSNLLLISPFNEGNPLQIPGQVSGEVVVAQFFALFVAVITQSDLLTSITLMYQGYSESLCQAFGKVSKIRWLLATMSMFLEGAFALFVTWMLIVTSDKVRMIKCTMLYTTH
jgi:hypothetical protein